MKENIVDNFMRGVVLVALAWFGLRGFLPDIAAAGYMPALLSAAVIAIAGYSVGPYAYRTYRCAQSCQATCDPQFCRAM